MHLGRTGLKYKLNTAEYIWILIMSLLLSSFRFVTTHIRNGLLFNYLMVLFQGQSSHRIDKVESYTHYIYITSENDLGSSVDIIVSVRMGCVGHVKWVWEILKTDRIVVGKHELSSQDVKTTRRWENNINIGIESRVRGCGVGTGTNDWFVWSQQWAIGVNQWQGISWLAQQVLSFSKWSYVL
jgi:hypothetical protein